MIPGDPGSHGHNTGACGSGGAARPAALLTTPRLRLRQVEAADAGALFAYRSQPQVSRYQDWVPADTQEAAEFVARLSATEFATPGHWSQLALLLRDSGELVGDCGLHFLEPAGAQVAIGISLDPQHHAKGFATEALSAVLGYLFGQLERHRVFASVDPRNEASARLLRRLGFRQEAHFVQSYFFRGEWVDDLVFAMLRSEFKE